MRRKWIVFCIFATTKRIHKNKNKKNMFGIGTQEILLIALVVLLFFGGKKIPELMKGLGKGVKSFKEGMNEVGLGDDEKKSDAKKDAQDNGVKDAAE